LAAHLQLELGCWCCRWQHHSGEVSTERTDEGAPPPVASSLGPFLSGGRRKFLLPTAVRSGPRSSSAGTCLSSTEYDRYRATLTGVAVCRRVAVRPSVRLCVTRYYCIETTGLFWAWLIPSAYPTLYYKKIWVPPKIRILSSGTLSRILDLGNLATAGRSCCQQWALLVEILSTAVQPKEQVSIGVRALLSTDV